MAMEVDEGELERLLASPDIDLLELDRIRRPMLKDSVPLIGGENGTFGGFSGSGTTIAILDTGVEKDHPFLAGKVVAEACFSTTYPPDGSTQYCTSGSTAAGSGQPCADIDAGCYHGTHVAGIAAGANGPANAPSGVARDATLIAVQVFSRFPAAVCGGSPCPSAYDSDIISGLEHVYNLRSTYNVASVNLSLGGGAYTSTEQCDADNAATKAAIDSLRAAGIATVIASGNEYYTNKMSSPGCISSAISVGATTKSDAIASYSNSAPFLKLLAPGSSIYSSITGGRYEYLSGTSMATPHVAGAWAVLKSVKPDATVDDIYNALDGAGKKILDSRNGVETSRIQLDRAVAVIGDKTPPEILAFSLRATPYLLSVAVDAFTVSEADVTYCLTESDDAASCAWMPVKPSNYAFTSFGSKTLYAFAKDKAGNLSVPASASVTIGNPIVIEGGKASTASQQVVVTLDPGSFPAASMQFLLDNAAAWTSWMPFAASQRLSLKGKSGLKTISVRFLAAGGEVTPIYRASIYLDKSAPSGTVSINGGATATSSATVSLTLTVTDAGEGPLQMRFSEDGKTWGAFVAFAPTCSYSFVDRLPGTKKVYVQFQDAAGNLSKKSFDAITYTQLESVTATQISDSINNGASYTASTGVSISLAPDSPFVGETIRLSNDGLKWSSWNSYNSSIPWVLQAGDGKKSVYLQRANDRVRYVTPPIVLDTTAPTGWLLLNGGSALTNDRRVMVTLGGADVNGLSGFCLRESSAACAESDFEAFVDQKEFMLSTGDGTKTLFLQLRDSAGNRSAVIKGSITLDTLPPSGTVTINNGASQTASSSVSLKLTAARAVLMQLSPDNGVSWGEVEPFARTKELTLIPDVNGLMTVRVRLWDAAGNEAVIVGAINLI